MYDKFERPSDKTMKSLFGIGREKAPPSEELLEELRDLAKINKTGDNHNDINDTKETYYVVERFDRYVDGVFTVYAGSVAYEKQLTTTKSLLDCYRYETYEQAKEFADKYDCNVRKVIVKVEE
ncbi:hypothetical protein [Mammaliicoccus sciuri]|uniref:hypothetical protein n=1 Tax=Mammaliicoccus sciuri TaxID=1296 RepID=UPI001A99B7E3|nr:hypothetical protein [Mammaliicoccus sciuri]MBO1209171.1 hypothetical protein [Mammaliicoccus sciuri]